MYTVLILNTQLTLGVRSFSFPWRTQLEVISSLLNLFSTLFIPLGCSLWSTVISVLILYSLLDYKQVHYTITLWILSKHYGIIFFFYCKIRLLMITLYNLLPIFDVTNFRVFEIGRILVGNWHKPQYLSSLNCFCDFFLFLPTKTCYVPSINASSKWRNKLG